MKNTKNKKFTKKNKIKKSRKITKYKKKHTGGNIHPPSSNTNTETLRLPDNQQKLLLGNGPSGTTDTNTKTIPTSLLIINGNNLNTSSNNNNNNNNRIRKKVGEGSYGCVYSPSFKCSYAECDRCSKNSSTNCQECDTTKNVSKVMTTQDAKIEFDKYYNLITSNNLDNNDQFYIKPIIKCEPTGYDITKIRKNLNSCKPIKQEDQISLLIYQNGGINLSQLLKGNDEYKISILDILTGLKNILEGIIKLGDNQIVHFDIKPDNIVTGIFPNSTDKNHTKSISFRIIDFGIAQQFKTSDIIQIPNISFASEKQKLIKNEEEKNRKKKLRDKDIKKINKILIEKLLMNDEVKKDTIKLSETELEDIYQKTEGMLRNRHLYVQPPYTNFLLGESSLLKREDSAIEFYYMHYHNTYNNNPYLKNLKKIFNKKKDENTVMKYEYSEFELTDEIRILMSEIMPVILEISDAENNINNFYDYKNNESGQLITAIRNNFNLNIRNICHKVIKMVDIYSFGLLLLDLTNFFPVNVYDLIEKFLISTEILSNNVNKSFEQRDGILDKYDELLRQLRQL
jgi:hypothetical protein